MTKGGGRWLGRHLQLHWHLLFGGSTVNMSDVDGAMSHSMNRD